MEYSIFLISRLVTEGLLTSKNNFVFLWDLTVDSMEDGSCGHFFLQILKASDLVEEIDIVFFSVKSIATTSTHTSMLSVSVAAVNGDRLSWVSNVITASIDEAAWF